MHQLTHCPEMDDDDSDVSLHNLAERASTEGFDRKASYTSTNDMLVAQAHKAGTSADDEEWAKNAPVSNMRRLFFSLF